MAAGSGRNSLAWRIAAALVLGTVAGELLGERAAFLGGLATALIQILKMLATPLVFFAVAEACSRTNIRWAQGRRLLTISLANAAVAGSIAIVLDRLVPLRFAGVDALREALQAGTPGHQKAATFSLLQIVEGLVPKSVVQPFADNEVVGAVALAVFAGFALRAARAAASPAQAAQLGVVDEFLSGVLRVLMTGLGWIVAIVPLAVFGILAKVVGHAGLGSFKSLGFFLALVTTGLLLQGGVYYALLLRLVARVPLRPFYRRAAEPQLTAMGTGSSLATLPVTIWTLQEEMGIRPENARLAAMVGTNLNHDGILLYEAAAGLFLARILGVPLHGSASVAAIVVSALAAFGIGGIPDAGLVTLSLVLGALKLPLAAVPLLLPLDWLIGRMRATLNVTSDLVVANVLEAWERRDEKPAAVTVEAAE